MFSKASRALNGALVLATLSALVLAGCGGEEVVDPYVGGTLDQVTRGAIQSENFLFEFYKPDFLYVEGNTGFVKSGNKIEIIVGDDLENRVSSWDDSTKIGVQKFFSPYVWLMAKRVKNGTQIAELDSVTSPVLPRLTRIDIEKVNGFDIGKLRYNKKKDIDDMLDAEVQTAGSLHYLPDHEAEAPAEVAVAADGADGDAAEVVEPAMAWYLKAQKTDAMFKITNVNDKLEMAFHLLENETLPFVGGVKIGEAYTWKDRNKSRVSCPVEISYVLYANRYLAP
jgi:hypothetical protein